MVSESLLISTALTSLFILGTAFSSLTHDIPNQKKREYKTPTTNQLLYSEKYPRNRDVFAPPPHPRKFLFFRLTPWPFSFFAWLFGHFTLPEDVFFPPPSCYPIGSCQIHRWDILRTSLPPARWLLGIHRSDLKKIALLPSE